MQHLLQVTLLKYSILNLFRRWKQRTQPGRDAPRSYCAMSHFCWLVRFTELWAAGKILKVTIGHAITRNIEPLLISEELINTYRIFQLDRKKQKQNEKHFSCVALSKLRTGKHEGESRRKS